MKIDNFTVALPLCEEYKKICEIKEKIAANRFYWTDPQVLINFQVFFNIEISDTLALLEKQIGALRNRLADLGVEI
jgi:hypothetical protein